MQRNRTVNTYFVGDEMKVQVTEFLGTFFLVFTIGCVSLQSIAGPTAAVAIAGVLAAMIYAGGHISGAHYNPAVTLAFFIRGKCAARDLIPYWLAQIAAAASAAVVCSFLFADSAARPLEIAGNVPKVLLVEFLFTFVLCFVILNVATAESLQPNQFYGAAIALVVLAGILSVGPLSGAVFNPAVAVREMAMGLLGRSHIWVYLLAHFLAAPAAAYLFTALNEAKRANS